MLYRFSFKKDKKQKGRERGRGGYSDCLSDLASFVVISDIRLIPLSSGIDVDISLELSLVF
jgi:hypothetical protein